MGAAYKRGQYLTDAEGQDVWVHGHAVGYKAKCEVVPAVRSRRTVLIGKSGGETVSLPRDLRELVVPGAELTLLEPIPRGLGYVGCAECTSVDNFHVHLIIDWDIGECVHAAWIGWIEALWGLGRVDVRDVYAPGGLLHYLIGADDADDQGEIAGNRTFISASARPPKSVKLGEVGLGVIPDLLRFAKGNRSALSAERSRLFRAADRAAGDEKEVLLARFAEADQVVEGLTFVAGKHQLLLKGDDGLPDLIRAAIHHLEGA